MVELTVWDRPVRTGTDRREATGVVQSLGSILQQVSVLPSGAMTFDLSSVGGPSLV